MSDATTRIALDTSSYEAGAKRISASDAEMARTAKATFSEVGEAARRAFDTVGEGPDRVARLASSVSQNSRRMVEDFKRVEEAARRVNSAQESRAIPMISRVGKMELMHAGRSIGGSLLSGAPIGRALEQEAPRIIEALGPAALKAAGGVAGLSAGLGGLAVAAAAVGAGLTVVNAQRESDKLRRANDLVGNVGNRNGDTVSELDKEIESARKSAQETRHLRHTKRNQFANLAGEAYSAVGIDGIHGTQDGDVMGIRNRKVSLEERRDAASERDLGFARRAFSGDESAEKDRLRVGMEEKVREIRASMVKDANALVAVERGGYELEVAKLDRVQKVNAENIGLERTLTFLKQQGADVEVRSAEARLVSARRVLELGPGSGNGYQANARVVEGASEELRLARRVGDERREEYSTGVTIAALTERADDRHLMALSLEEQKLKGRLASPAYGADEKMGMSTALMDNQGEQREIFRQRTARADEGWLNQRASSYERGYGGQRQGLLDRQTILKGEIERNTSGTDAGGQTVFKDANLGAQQLAQAHQLQQTLEEIAHTRERSIKDAEQTVRVAGLEAHGMRETATIAAEIYGWDSKIAEARFAQNNDVADQYEKLKGIAQEQRKIHDFLHPEDRAAERATARATDRVQRGFDKNAGLLNPVLNGDGEVIGGRDPATGENRATTPEERRASKRARDVSPYTGETMAKDAFGSYESTPQMFAQTDAERRLVKAHGAADLLARLSGDPAHDPAARLAKASVFRDFHKDRNVAEQDRRTIPGPDPKISALTGQVTALTGLVNKLAAGMDKLAGKIGVA